MSKLEEENPAIKRLEKILADLMDILLTGRNATKKEIEVFTEFLKEIRLIED